MRPDAGLLWTVWVGWAVLWVGLSWLVIRRWRLPQKPGPVLILTLALGVRLGYALLMPPTLSDDIWRYLWDGQTLAAGQNPYATAPAEAMAELDKRAESGALMPGDRQRRELLAQINHPELVTIYQPTSQWFFAGVATLHQALTGGYGTDRQPSAETVAGALSGESGEGPARPLSGNEGRWSQPADQGAGAGLGMSRWFRVALILVDGLIVLLLMRQLRELGRSVWWAVMYAWNPLVVLEVGWSGHQDGLGVLMLIGALMLSQRASRGRGEWWCAAGGGALLGLAGGVKPIVLPLALPLVWKLWRDAGPGLRAWAAGRVTLAAASCLAVLAMLYLPFVVMEGGLGRMFETAGRFVGAWRFNGSLHPLIETAAAGLLSFANADAEPAAGLWARPEAAKWLADSLCCGVLLVVLVAATLSHRVPWRAATTYLFVLICVSSTAHPWYLIWALALLPVAWSAGPTVVAPAVWVASLTLGWSYVAHLRAEAGQGFTVGVWWSLAIWLPVYLAVGYGWLKTRGQQLAQR